VKVYKSASKDDGDKVGRVLKQRKHKKKANAIEP
jgi:hypothetical protein